MNQLLTPWRQGRFLTRAALLAVVVIAASAHAQDGRPAEESPEARPAGEADWTVPEWPRQFSDDAGGTLVLYQPQVLSWEGYRVLETRLAAAVSRPGEETPALGALVVRMDTDSDPEERLVRLSNFQITGGDFPTEGEEESARLRSRLAGLLPESIVVSLDRVLAGLERGSSEAREVAVRPEPPQIFVRTAPAVLVQFDGEPVLSPIEGSDLQFSVNTNWDVFYDDETVSWYLRDGDTWYRAPKAEGPWKPAGKLPKRFKKLPKKDESWTEVRESYPGREIRPWQMPEVLITTEPAELILLDGEPSLTPLADNDLLWVTNTESDLFLYGPDSHFYYLVSGRWFKADDLDGPWTFTTPELPEAFQEIPEDHPRAHVRAAVPGTAEAREAVILAHIPQKATVERGEVTAEVSYVGEPQFEPVEGTSMAYAVNTQSDVLRVGDLYYLCFQAVWFVSTSPEGPWEVAASIPEEVYTIPPSEPVHHVTYVHVYDHSPASVTFGYTSGYWGVYYSWGCMVYGTGWYYDPWYYYGPYYPYPLYYPWPASYGVAAWYNPATGTYGRGASVYGPYGGFGRAAAWNPTTGTYARGGAAWGPYNARGWAEAYNPRTGTYARTRQGANVYGNWGTTAVRRGDDWVRTARAGGEQGSIRGFRTSEGTGGFVGRDANNLYAGRDGNVYRRDESGWQKHGGDGWTPVEGPDRAAIENRLGERGVGSGERIRDAGAADRGSIERSTLDQLRREAAARDRGARNAARNSSWRASGGGSRGSWGSPGRARGGFSGRRGGGRGF